MGASQWLLLSIGLQLGLFSLGRWVASGMAVPSRRPMQGLAVFNLGLGLGTALTGLRGLLPYALTHPAANLLSLAAFTVLWHAGQALTGKRHSSREQAAVLLLGGSLILWFGGSAQTAQQRVACYFLATAWIGARGGWQGYVRLRQESLHAAALALLATGWTIAALFVWRAVVGLFFGAPAELDHASQTTNLIVLVVLVAVYSVNVVFAHIIFGRLLAQLHHLSRHDSLTGLCNRHAIVEALSAHWQRFTRGGPAFAVACVDIDHFKAVNDGYGHAAGDAALVGVAQRLAGQLRPGDVLGRSGGEEFLVLIQCQETAAALLAATRLQRAVCEAPSLHPDAGQLLSVSIGVATTQAGDASLDTLLARADGALYRAKAGGRNTVCQAEDAVGTGTGTG